jgi:hypothetical protein
MTSQPQFATAFFTALSVSAQSWQPAVKTSILRLSAILAPLYVFAYLVAQQHLPSVLPVSLQTSFPPFCSQQHVLIVLPVSPQTYFGPAASVIDPSVAATSTGNDFFRMFIIVPPLMSGNNVHLGLSSKVKGPFTESNFA